MFSRITTFIAFLLAFGLLVTAVPTKRSNADVEAVFNTLKSKTASILPQFGELVNNGSASDTTVQPLITELTNDLNEAKSSLSGLAPAKLVRRQSDQDVANLVAGIVSDIANALNPLQGAKGGIPSLSLFLTEVDVALNEVLLGLSVVIDGVLILVGALLHEVGVILAGLSFALVTGLLGL